MFLRSSYFMVACIRYARGAHLTFQKPIYQNINIVLMPLLHLSLQFRQHCSVSPTLDGILPAMSLSPLRFSVRFLLQPCFQLGSSVNIMGTNNVLTSFFFSLEDWNERSILLIWYFFQVLVGILAFNSRLVVGSWMVNYIHTFRNSSLLGRLLRKNLDRYQSATTVFTDILCQRCCVSFRAL